MAPLLNLLALDTSTERLSLAVQNGAEVHTHEAAGGAQASGQLIAALYHLLAQAGLSLDQLDALVFGRGPGSFTGVRTACAVAQGLAFGARAGRGLAVLPVDTLLAVAEDAHARYGCTRVVAVLDARMDEVYCARYERDQHGWRARGELAVLAPEAVEVPPDWVLAGNAQAAYGTRLGGGAEHLFAQPRAAALLRLAPALLLQGLGCTAADALPLYVRDKVAQTTAERAARAARSVSP